MSDFIMAEKSINKLRKLLNSRIFNKNLNDANLILGSLKKSKTIEIMYGETYDVYGLTVDSLKYYLLLEYITQILRVEGYKVSSTLLIGDTASIRNDGVLDKEQLLKVIKTNISKIQDIKNKYKLTFDIKIMSEVFYTNAYKTNYTDLVAFTKNNTEVYDVLSKTVLKNKLKQEISYGFRYALEEVALISEYDLKLGPPREIYYDKVSQLFKPCRPIGIYVSPTYPLGLNYDFYINNPEIEEYGLTPYKAGSNKLLENRFILNNISRSKLENLISKSFISSDNDLPNPVRDLYYICCLSKAVKNNTTLVIEEFSLVNLDKILLEELYEYIEV